MSNFKIYLEKAQGNIVNIDISNFINENFASYLRSVTVIEEEWVFDFKVIGSKLFGALDDLEDSAVADPINTAKYKEIGDADAFLSYDTNKKKYSFTKKGIQKLKDKFEDLKGYDLNSVSEFEIDNVNSEFKVEKIESIITKADYNEAIKSIVNQLKNPISIVSFEQRFKGAFKTNGLDRLHQNIEKSLYLDKIKDTAKISNNLYSANKKFNKLDPSQKIEEISNLFKFEDGTSIVSIFGLKLVPRLKPKKLST